MKEMFSSDMTLLEEAKELVLHEWKDEKWLSYVNLNTLNVSKKIKTLIGKIKHVNSNKGYIYRWFYEHIS